MKLIKLRRIAPILALLTLNMCSSVTLANGWSGDGEVGFVRISGNTESENLNLGLELVHEGELWTHSFSAETYKTSSEDIELANSVSLEYLLERSVGVRSNLFFGLGYLDDDFDGFTEQVSTAAGYGYSLFDNETVLWNLAAGVGYRDTERIPPVFEDLSDDDEDPLLQPNAAPPSIKINSSDLVVDGATFVIRSDFEYQLTDTTLFTDNFKGEIGSDNSFYENEAAVEFLINSSFSFKVGILHRHNTDPLDAVEKTDTITTFSLVYSLGN